MGMAEQAEQIDVKQAVEAAELYLASLTDLFDIRLEEVAVSSDKTFWHITLSGLAPAPTDGGKAGRVSIGAIFAPPERIYKDLKVDATTGSVESMKIRKV
jgi:hypothetical protein